MSTVRSFNIYVYFCFLFLIKSLFQIELIFYVGQKKLGNFLIEIKEKERGKIVCYKDSSRSADRIPLTKVYTAGVGRKLGSKLCSSTVFNFEITMGRVPSNSKI